MDYLDYLPHTPYSELPQRVQEQIAEDDYLAMQRLISTIEPKDQEGLPADLRAAYQQQLVSLSEGSTTLEQATAAPIPTERRQYGVWWMAAAGWLLLAVAASALLLREPTTKIVYREVAGPTPAPIVIRDTITETITDYRTKFITQRDTIFVPQALPPQLVHLRDTIYLPTKELAPVQLVKSKAAAKERRLLDLLVETE